VKQPHRIGEAEIEEGAEAGASLGLEQRIIDPQLRPLDVERRRNDVEVAGQDECLLVPEQRARPRRQAVHPVELVFELVGADRIAVREIEAGDADDGAVARNHHLHIARMLVGIGAGQAAGDVLERPLGENGDAVEALLAVHGEVVAKLLQRFPRKCLVLAFDLLEAADVGRRFLQPAQQIGEARLDAVDVPCGDLHQSMVL
jgi:hypothetical protein